MIIPRSPHRVAVGSPLIRGAGFHIAVQLEVAHPARAGVTRYAATKKEPDPLFSGTKEWPTLPSAYEGLGRNRQSDKLHNR